MSGGQFSVPIVFRGPTGNAGMLSSPAQPVFRKLVCQLSRGLKVELFLQTLPDAKGFVEIIHH